MFSFNFQQILHYIYTVSFDTLISMWRFERQKKIQIHKITNKNCKTQIVCSPLNLRRLGVCVCVYIYIYIYIYMYVYMNAPSDVCFWNWPAHALVYKINAIVISDDIRLISGLQIIPMKSCMSQFTTKLGTFCSIARHISIFHTSNLFVTHHSCISIFRISFKTEASAALSIMKFVYTYIVRYTMNARQSRR